MFALILLAEPLLARTPARETPQAAARRAVCGSNPNEDTFRALATRKSGNTESAHELSPRSSLALTDDAFRDDGREDGLDTVVSLNA